MIKITSVEINGFINSSQKVKLDFADSNVICIYGDNGSGKTTFLEILFAVFARDEKILEKYNVDSIKINYSYENIEILRQINELKSEKNIEDSKYQIIDLENQVNNIENISIYLDEADDDKGNSYTFYNFSALDDSALNNISSLMLGIGRGIHKKKLSTPRNTLWHFFRTHKKIAEDKVLTGNEIDTLSEKLANHLMPKNKTDIDRREDEKVESFIDKKSVYFPYVEIDTIEQLLFNRYQKAVLDAKEQIDKALITSSMNFLQGSSRSVELDADEFRDKLLYNKPLIIEMYGKDEESGIVHILKEIESYNQSLDTLDSSKRVILFNIIEKLENEVELFKQIQIFLDEYNGFLNYDKELVINIEGIKIAPHNHTLGKLSSGERHLLTFLATILLMGDKKEFILIDEPEISLNVDWQREILSTIAKLAPNSQIIVATHSPLVARGYRKSVVGIKLEDR